MCMTLLLTHKDPLRESKKILYVILFGYGVASANKKIYMKNLLLNL